MVSSMSFLSRMGTISYTRRLKPFYNVSPNNSNNSYDKNRAVSDSTKFIFIRGGPAKLDSLSVGGNFLFLNKVNVRLFKILAYNIVDLLFIAF